MATPFSSLSSCPAKSAKQVVAIDASGIRVLAVLEQGNIDAECVRDHDLVSELGDCSDDEGAGGGNRRSMKRYQK